MASKQENENTLSIIIAAIINIIMNVYFISKYEASGAIISLIAAEYIGIIIQLILVRKQLAVKKYY
ncbi:polysaccharide biosynthesis C-terminal domain-containing protein [uncultured Clostridium sp.]|uniref:polysaccharide biosynthesis C-terminal domain-containing protein n=1 Tax=uncultured Clostridium sp. TaxID=59620 RepID=UPI00260E9B25|nr:polysaccharide biosynthesis C-terminal domain-containing protein [uncultured Clostridium sp.]